MGLRISPFMRRGSFASYGITLDPDERYLPVLVREGSDIQYKGGGGEMA